MNREKPPVDVDDGSTVRTATRTISWVVKYLPNFSIRLDFPAPGGPVMPFVYFLVILLFSNKWRVDRIKQHNTHRLSSISSCYSLDLVWACARLYLEAIEPELFSQHSSSRWEWSNEPSRPVCSTRLLWIWHLRSYCCYSIPPMLNSHDHNGYSWLELL